MKSLPPQLTAYRKTPVFTQDTVPNALLNQHTIKAESWGKIWVTSGKLGYRILTDIPEDHVLTPESPGIVEPQVPHQVKPIGPVTFYVEFYHAEDR